MKIDDASKPEFNSWESYQKFASSVKHRRRYVYSEEVRAFLETVLVTNRDRDVRIPKGTIFYRAQRGIEYRSQTDEDGIEIGEYPVGFGKERMKPRKDKSLEGRINPVGITVLYLATTVQTAISEIRPWVDAAVSVAQFKTLKDVKAIDLSRGHGKFSIEEVIDDLLNGKQPDADTKEKAVWVDIDSAFSRPVTLSDGPTDYVPTQVLAELFSDVGYDAVVYKSHFGDDGYNIGLFNVADAEAINCAPYRVAEIEVKFEEAGNRWYSIKHLDEEKN